MNVLFEKVYEFFSSLSSYNFYYDHIFFFSAIIFLIAVIWVGISTSRAYEPRLVKVIDKLNIYFADNPQITEDNLIAFNDKMKSKKVPKQLRKCWQQFVLYREGKASEYMSFDNCVNKPIKNSTFKRDITTLNLITYMIVTLDILLNIFCSYEDDAKEINLKILQEILMGPAVFLLVNLLVTIFLDIRHNAIVTDLYQNYQYFEVNIDKATATLPEFIDYELLFDKNEIKRGIPILYSYLQKRAEEEKKELEMARLKNIEHEKYDFDEAGVDGSLVLERAMQEAENYIAERKKLNQDAEQINVDIGDEDANYREVIKEYNRQMQVSKETFDNFKASLEEASSSIETNYLKKQQQQELDRQRNLERDFDLATERHKKILEGFQKELDEIDKTRTESRQALESAMKSEFESYSKKVYDKVKEMVEEQQEDKFNEMKSNVQELEETIAGNGEKQNEYYEDGPDGEADVQEEQEYQDIEQPEGQAETFENQEEPQDVTDEYADEYAEADENVEEPIEDENVAEESNENEVAEQTEDDLDDDFEMDEELPETEEDEDEGDDDFDSLDYDFEDEKQANAQEPVNYVPQAQANQNNISAVNSTDTKEESIDEEFGETVHPHKHPGRPRKIKTVDLTPKRGPGRPRKIETAVEPTEKRGPGRPRKEQVETYQVKRGRGRPRKNQGEGEMRLEKRRVGRPKKDESGNIVASPVKKRRGRPAKALTSDQLASTMTVRRGRGRPKKIEKLVIGEGTKSNSITTPEIDSYLEKINDAIERENERIMQTQMLLESQSKLNKNKR